MSEDKQWNPLSSDSKLEDKDYIPQHYVLKLYIAGHTARSIQAISTTKTFCESHLQGQYQLEIVDVYKDSEDTQTEQILTVPMLIRKFPLPQRKLVGDLSNVERLRNWLELDPYN